MFYVPPIPSVRDVRLRLALCTGSIPEQMGQLDKLEVLRLEDNKLTGEAIGA